MPDTQETQCLWRINQRCNFRCSYCFRTGIDDPRLGASRLPSAEQIAGAFTATGRRWRIHLTGGEPFLHPDIVQISTALTREHRLSVNTNLIPAAVRRFGDAVDPSRIHSLNATWHADEIAARGLEIRWLDTFLRLQSRGINIRLMCLAHPLWLRNLPGWVARWRDAGVAQVYIKIFRGMWNGRPYPECFSPDDVRLILLMGLTPHEQNILEGVCSFRGRPCRAGVSAFNLDESGNITRCSGVSDGYGNLFDGTFSPDSSPRPCQAKGCACPYQGLHFSSPPPDGECGGVVD